MPRLRHTVKQITTKLVACRVARTTSTALGDHIVLWQIRCDDGVFSSETTYGEIKIKIIPLSGLVKRAEERLGIKP
jgi:hypothetical protein